MRPDHPGSQYVSKPRPPLAHAAARRAGRAGLSAAGKMRGGTHKPAAAGGEKTAPKSAVPLLEEDEASLDPSKPVMYNNPAMVAALPRTTCASSR
jgi:hypothetical protein